MTEKAVAYFFAAIFLICAIPVTEGVTQWILVSAAIGAVISLYGAARRMQP